MEALAIVFVFAVAAIIFVVTWFGVANAPRNAVAELDQLEQYRDVLQKKALRAQLERWDDEMLDQISYQLDEVEQRIAEVGKRA